MSGICHTPTYSTVDADLKVKIGIINRIQLKFNPAKIQKRIKQAQFELDGNIMHSMIPFMPMITGTFINQTVSASSAVQGSGIVYAGYGVQARYLYMGNVMVDSATGRGAFYIKDVGFRFHKGAVLVATQRPLQYTKNTHPEATSHWFEKAKMRDGAKWVAQASRTIKGK